jgi:hypothetical protein
MSISLMDNSAKITAFPFEVFVQIYFSILMMQLTIFLKLAVVLISRA